jgi:TPP-dependent trihydroxycyclohexane-1,2-dione (THcHDO) dehydratase
MHMRGNSHLAAKAGLTVTVRTPFIDPSLSRSSPDVSRSYPVRISGNASAQGLTQVLKPIDEQHADIDLLVNAVGGLPEAIPGAWRSRLRHLYKKLHKATFFITGM